jgi:hypothetical protein
VVFYTARRAALDLGYQVLFGEAASSAVGKSLCRVSKSRTGDRSLDSQGLQYDGGKVAGLIRFSKNKEKSPLCAIDECTATGNMDCLLFTRECRDSRSRLQLNSPH